MALIKCPECGKEVSDKAPACIHCGYPLLTQVEKTKVPFKRIFSNGTRIGYPCKTCDYFHRLFEVTYSDAEITKAECVVCHNKEIIDFSNVVITIEEFNGIDEEIRLKNYAVAVEKLVSITNCEEDICKKYVEEAEKERIRLEEEFEKRTGRKIKHTFEKDMPKSRPVESHTPKCPTCQSPNIKKVSLTSKAGSVALWGLFSQKVKKTWHCNNCGYEW